MQNINKIHYVDPQKSASQTHGQTNGTTDRCTDRPKPSGKAGSNN